MTDHENNMKAATHGDLQAIKKDLEDVAETVREVHQAIVGNHLTQDGGMVRRLLECEKDIEDIQNMVETIERNNVKSNTYLHIAYAIGGAFLTMVITMAVNKLFGK